MAPPEYSPLKMCVQCPRLDFRSYVTEVLREKAILIVCSGS